jgi:gamma-polyglutamate biosynthesis protein CapA
MQISDSFKSVFLYSLSILFLALTLVAFYAAFLREVPGRYEAIISGESEKRFLEEVFGPIFVSSPESQSVEILFVGDMMLGRHVETLIGIHGEEYPFDRMGDILSSSDFTIGNLEGPIALSHTQTPNGSTSFSFKESIAPLLAAQGFDLVTLGNNHTSDRGEESYLHTREVLEAVGIASSGHALEAREDAIHEVEIDGQSLQVFSFNMTFPSNDEQEAVQLVATHAEQEAITMVEVHWGIEYALTSSRVQEEFARALIDAGADVIIGHHPHVTQEVDLYKGAPIFYSLGNFVFDQYFSQDTQEGLAVRMTVSNGDLVFDLLPLESHLSQPSLQSGEFKESFLDALADRSGEEVQNAVRDGILTISRR